MGVIVNDHLASCSRDMGEYYNTLRDMSERFIQLSYESKCMMINYVCRFIELKFIVDCERDDTEWGIIDVGEYIKNAHPNAYYGFTQLVDIKIVFDNYSGTELGRSKISQFLSGDALFNILVEFGIPGKPDAIPIGMTTTTMMGGN